MHISEVISEIAAWASQDPEPDYRDAALLLIQRLKEGDPEALKTAEELFGSRLSFGTAGIRGPMRMGPNGINRIVIAQTTAGIASFLKQNEVRADTPDIQVVIGFDGRHHSEEFARDAAKILSGHKISVFLFSQVVPTPVLAFAVRALGADAGIMITASHNPSGDNGYKVYLGGAHEGSQIVSPIDNEVEAHIQTRASSETWTTMTRSTDLITYIGDELVQDYISASLIDLNLPERKSDGLTVVYSAMHGVGGKTFLATLLQAGFTQPYIVKEQFEPDPDFPSVKFPNPEEAGALELSFRTARKVKAELIIAHDPDADRLAAALPDPTTSSSYAALTGNEVGAIFGWYLSKKALESNNTGTLANSIVSSPILGKIARHFGLNHEETLSGFKYLSRVKNLIFGFEEALGYLVTPGAVRDKDGISAAVLIMQISNALAEEGQDLWGYLLEIQETVGFFASKQITLNLASFSDAKGVSSALRDEELSAIGESIVCGHDDFLTGVGHFPRADILRYFLDDGTRVIIRPSGTEAKIKFYIDTEGNDIYESSHRLAKTARSVENLVNSIQEGRYD